MDEKLYEIAGTQFTESEIINRYGDEKFRKGLAKGIIKEVRAEKPKSAAMMYDISGVKFSEQEAIDRYGEDKFRKGLDKGVIKPIEEDQKDAAMMRPPTPTQEEEPAQKKSPDLFGGESDSGRQSILQTDGTGPRADKAAPEKIGVTGLQEVAMLGRQMAQKDIEKKEFAEKQFSSIYESKKSELPEQFIDKRFSPEIEVKTLDARITRLKKSLEDYNNSPESRAVGLSQREANRNVIRREIRVAEEQKDKLLIDNSDIYRRMSGNKYFVDGKEVPFSEAFRYLTSPESISSMRKDLEAGKTPNVRSDGDDDFNSMVKDQLEAIQRGRVDRFVPEIRAIVSGSILKAGGLILDLERSAAVSFNEGVLGMSSDEALRTAYGEKTYNELKRDYDASEQKKSGMSMLEYFDIRSKEKREESAIAMAGVTPIIEGDIIDMLQQGELDLASREIASMTGSSIGYMLLSASGAPGSAAIFGSIAPYEYASARMAGVNKGRAFVGSVTNATIEMADNLISVAFAKQALNGAKRMAISTGTKAGLTGSALRDFTSKAVTTTAEGIIKEAPTEFLQEGGNETVRQLTYDEDIDFDRIMRNGAIGSIAATPTAGAFTLPANLKVLSTTFKEWREGGRRVNAVMDLLTEAEMPENRSVAKELREEAINIIEAEADFLSKRTEAVKSATPEQQEQLKILTLEEESIAKSLSSPFISDKTREFLEGRQEEVENQKSGLLQEIERQAIALQEEQKRQAEKAAEAAKRQADGAVEVVIDKPTIVANSKPEVDNITSASRETETGQTFNSDGTVYSDGGLVIPIVSENLTQEELTPERIAEFAERHKNKIGSNDVKVGIYKFPDSNQVSIDLNIVVPRSSRDVGVDFGRIAGQESLFDLDTFENVKTGADGSNPMTFTDEQFKEIARALGEGRMPNLEQQQQQQTDEKAKQEEPMLEGVSDGGDQKEGAQDGAELRTEEATQKEVEAKKADIERERQEELNKPLDRVKSAKTRDELIEAAEEWIGINPYDDGATSMGTRSLLMTPGSFQKGKEAFINENKEASKIRDRQINAEYDAKLKALEQQTEQNKKQSEEVPLQPEAGGSQEVQQAQQEVGAQEGGPDVQEEVAEEEVRKAPPKVRRSIRAAASLGKVRAKGVKGLYSIYRRQYAMPAAQAAATALVSDRLITSIAKRIAKKEGIPLKDAVAKAYSRIQFADKRGFNAMGLSERGKALYQVIGPNANLQETVRQNLDVAEQMEAAGKDAKTIRLATGWERGAEGKWRYEIPDNIPFLNDTVNTINEFFSDNVDDGSGILGYKAELILPQELLDLYPQLAEVSIFFDRNISEFNGSYSSSEKSITVGVYNKNAVGIILHEVQHAIQDIEGFARGGSYREFIEQSAEEIYNEDQMEAFNVIQDMFNRNVDPVDILLYRDRLDPKKREAFDYVLDNPQRILSVGESQEKYRKLAGEVEARNVQARMNMTPEQRMATTLRETEDVARDEQIILFNQGAIPEGAMFQSDSWGGWKSTAAEGVSKVQQKSATPEQWVKMISDKGGKGTSQELEWIGLSDYLSDWAKENNSKSVPKEVVEQYINDNQIEIVEVGKGGSVAESDIDALLEDEVGEGMTREEAREYLSDDEQNTQTKYSEYTLEGGQNYREVLLTLPSENKLPQGWKIERRKNMTIGNSDRPFNVISPEGKVEYVAKSREDAIALLRKFRKTEPDKFQSTHFDEPNILAHLRLNERTLPNGERVLFIEEVQSDWAQEGKKKGFGKREKITENDIEIISDEKGYYDSEMMGYDHRVKFRVKGFDDIDSVTYNDGLNSKERSIIDLKKRLVNDYNRELLQEGRTPDMPYKKTDQWVGMAMRRAMQMAAQEGFDRIAWVTGEQSADRYDLAKKVSTIGYNGKKDGTYDVVVKDLDSRDLLNKNMTIDEIESTLGKEIANKIQSNEHGNDISATDVFERQIWEENGYITEGVLEGENLEVGGEGMKAFYNSILPKVAKKEAQRFDKKASIEVADFRGKSERETAEALGDDALPPSLDRATKQLSIAITPEMRMNLNSAIPLFQSARGAMMMKSDTDAVIFALTDPNVSTPLHELAHVFEHYLTDQEKDDVLKSYADATGDNSGVWSVGVSEYFARGFEKYLSDGVAPTDALKKIFELFKEWLTDIYNGVTGSDIDVKLNDKMKAIYDSMLTGQAARKSTKAPSTRQVTRQIQKKKIDRDKLKDAFDNYVKQVNQVMANIRAKIDETKKERNERIDQLKKEYKDLQAQMRQAVKDLKDDLKQLAREQKDDKAAVNALAKAVRDRAKSLGLKSTSQKTLYTMIEGFKKVDRNNLNDYIDEVVDQLKAEWISKQMKQADSLWSKVNKKNKRGDYGNLATQVNSLLAIPPGTIPENLIVEYVDLLTRLQKVFSPKLAVNVSEEIGEFFRKNESELDSQAGLLEELKKEFARITSQNQNLTTNKERLDKLKENATTNGISGFGVISEEDFDYIVSVNRKAIINAATVSTPKTKNETAERQNELTKLKAAGRKVDIRKFKDEVLKSYITYVNRATDAEILELTSSEIKALRVMIAHANNGMINKTFIRLAGKLDGIHLGEDMLSSSENINATTAAANQMLSSMDEVRLAREQAKSVADLDATVQKMLNKSANMLGRLVKKMSGSKIYTLAINKYTSARDKVSTDVNKVKTELNDMFYSMSTSFGGPVYNSALLSLYFRVREKALNPNELEIGDPFSYLVETIKDSSTGKSKVEALSVLAEKYFDGYEKLDDNQKLVKLGQIQQEILSEIKSRKGGEIISYMDKIVEQITPKAKFLAEVVTGKPWKQYTGYQPRTTAARSSMNPDEIAAERVKKYTRASTKSKRIDGRQAGDRALTFDAIGDFIDLYEDVNMHYEVSLVMSRIASMVNHVKKKGDKKMKLAADVIERYINQDLSSSIVSDKKRPGFLDRVVSRARKNIVTSILSGYVAKLPADTASMFLKYFLYSPIKYTQNMSALRKVKAQLKGQGYTTKDILSVIGSTHKERAGVYHDEIYQTVSSLVDQVRREGYSKNMFERINQKFAVKVSKSKKLRSFKRGASMFAEAPIRLPDKMTTSVYVAGEFINKFEELSGRKLDANKLMNDANYRAANKRFIDEARGHADKIGSRFGNIGTIAERAISARNTSAIEQIKTFMWSFPANESENFYAALESLWTGEGEFDVGAGKAKTRISGIAYIMSQSVSMVAYQVFRHMIMNAVLNQVMGFIFGTSDSDDDEESKVIKKALYRGFVDMALTNFFGRQKLFARLATMTAVDAAVMLAAELSEDEDTKETLTMISDSIYGLSRFTSPTSMVKQLGGPYGIMFDVAYTMYEYIMDKSEGKKPEIPMTTLAMAAGMMMALPAGQDILSVLRRYEMEKRGKSKKGYVNKASASY